MDIVKVLEKIVGIRQEVLEVSERLNHLQGELDLQISEMIEFLKHRGIVETKSS